MGKHSEYGLVSFPKLKSPAQPDDDESENNYGQTVRIQDDHCEVQRDHESDETTSCDYVKGPIKMA
eukprot:CAMPEP_0182832292 /NCGR_PEP_ID=MMETSP0006_2-20121128/19634_1 /TAXON_ID=97485 /ORGANISM="Prymnesium parvum, Strain Texoma1" /LENGTH=65 /DNA_ID=CAMNT_0024960123 /DNA_START=234 /DNA_END=431 /DNA_ORIENTATION=-